MKDKILMEISIELDQIETKTQRDTADIFEWLGDIGGFQLIMEILLGSIAEYFSSKFLAQGLAKKLYVFKFPKEKKFSEKERFQEIKISTLQLFTDPVINMLLPFKSCGSFSCRKRA